MTHYCTNCSVGTQSIIFLENHGLGGDDLGEWWYWYPNPKSRCSPLQCVLTVQLSAAGWEEPPAHSKKTASEYWWQHQEFKRPGSGTSTCSWNSCMRRNREAAHHSHTAHLGGKASMLSCTRHRTHNAHQKKAAQVCLNLENMLHKTTIRDTCAWWNYEGIQKK